MKSQNLNNRPYRDLSPLSQSWVNRLASAPIGDFGKSKSLWAPWDSPRIPWMKIKYNTLSNLTLWTQWRYHIFWKINIVFTKLTSDSQNNNYPNQKSKWHLKAIQPRQICYHTKIDILDLLPQSVLPSVMRQKITTIVQNKDLSAIKNHNIA